MSCAETKESDPVVPTVPWKPGQKFATPSPGNGDRVFYETLYQQNPDSEMAQDWVLAYGILSNKEAENLLKKISKRGSNSKPKASAAVSSSQLKSPEKLVASKKRSKKSAVVLEDNDAGNEDSGAVWEGKGTTGV